MLDQMTEESQTPALDALGDRQRAFVLTYCGLQGSGTKWSAAQAAREAGYADNGNISRIVWEVLGVPKVRAAIDEQLELRRQQWGELLHRTVEELSHIAFANLTDVVDLGDGVVAIRGEMTEAGKRALSEVTETSVEMRGHTTRTLKVKMHNKVQALTLLAKITGGIVERHAGANGRDPIGVDVGGGLTQAGVNALMGAMGMPTDEDKKS